MDFIQQDNFASPANRIELWALQAKRQDIYLLSIPQSRVFCQQEELGRKCPSVQCNAQSPLVLTCPTRSFMVDRQNEIQGIGQIPPTQPALQWLGFSLQGCMCLSILLLLHPEFPQKTLQHDHNRAICSLPGSLPQAARGEPHKASRSPGAFVRKWEPIRAPREAFHGVREQPRVTSVWVVWGGEPFTRCVHSSHRGEWLQAVWLMRAGMCNCLDEGSRLDCCTGYQACICRRKDRGNCFQGQTDMDTAHWDARALQPCGRQWRRSELQPKAEVECDRWHFWDKGRMEAVGLHSSTFLSFRAEMAAGQNCPVGYCCHRSQHTGLCGPKAWGEGRWGLMALGPQDLTSPRAGGRHGMVTQPPGPSGHLPSGAGPGSVSAKNEIAGSWQAACPPRAVILSDHLGENGWVPRPAAGQDNKGRARVIHRCCQTLPSSTPLSRAWVPASSAPQWPPDTVFKSSGFNLNPLWILHGWLSAVANSRACTFERPFWRKNKSRLHLIVLLSLWFPLVCPWVVPTAKIPSPNRDQAAVISIG